MHHQGGSTGHHPADASPTAQPRGSWLRHLDAPLGVPSRDHVANAREFHQSTRTLPAVSALLSLVVVADEPAGRVRKISGGQFWPIC